MPDGPFKNLKQLNHYLKNTDCFFYSIYSKRHKKYCGLASYLRIQPKAGSIEVGYITYSPIFKKNSWSNWDDVFNDEECVWDT